MITDFDAPLSLTNNHVHPSRRLAVRMSATVNSRNLNLPQVQPSCRMHSLQLQTCTRPHILGSPTLGPPGSQAPDEEFVHPNLERGVTMDKNLKWASVWQYVLPAADCTCLVGVLQYALHLLQWPPFTMVTGS